MSSHHAKIIWLTGLSGSGKTTIATLLEHRLLDLHKKVRVLDGDDVRRELHTHLGFSPADILENNRLILELCQKYQPDYDFILVPVITPFQTSRDLARKTLKTKYFEIYVQASLATCIQRDVKGLYKKALQGEIPHFIGIAKDVRYQIPTAPDLVINTEQSSITESAELIIKQLL